MPSRFTSAQAKSTACSGPTAPAKTTTLRMLLGLLQPTAGWATVAGFRSDSSPNEVKRRVGLVSATAGLYPHLSVREMLLFFADLYGCEAGQAGAELDKLAELLGIDEAVAPPRRHPVDGSESSASTWRER